MFAQKPMKSRSKMIKLRERKAITNLVDPEIKFLDVKSITNPTWNGLFVPLTDVPQGASLNQRQGSFIHPKRCEIRGCTEYSGNDDVLRLVVCRLLYDEFGAAVSNLLTDTGTAIGVFSAGNIDFLGQSIADRKIEVLHDQTWVVTGDWHKFQPFHIKLNLMADEHNAVRYRSSGANDMPVEGALVMMLISQQSAGPSVSYFARTSFTDS